MTPFASVFIKWMIKNSLSPQFANSPYQNSYPKAQFLRQILIAVG